MVWLRRDGSIECVDQMGVRSVARRKTFCSAGGRCFLTGDVGDIWAGSSVVGGKSGAPSGGPERVDWDGTVEDDACALSGGGGSVWRGWPEVPDGPACEGPSTSVRRRGGRLGGGADSWA